MPDVLINHGPWTMDRGSYRSIPIPLSLPKLAQKYRETGNRPKNEEKNNRFDPDSVEKGVWKIEPLLGMCSHLCSLI
jgi:hypothetical protein